MRMVVLDQVRIRRTEVPILEPAGFATLVPRRRQRSRRKLLASDVMANGRHQRSSEQEESSEEKLLQLPFAEDVECTLASPLLYSSE